MPEDYLRAREAAFQAGTHTQHVYEAIRCGRLRVQRRVGKVFIASPPQVGEDAFSPMPLGTPSPYSPAPRTP